MKTLPIIPVILSGGMGSRLWPMSRKKYPKQFLNLGSDEGSMLQQTVKRVAGTLENIQNPLIVCNINHRFLVAEHMLEAGFDDIDIILEPEGRNTAPAITVAALHIKEKYGDDALMLVLASDHIVNDEAEFISAVEIAAETAASANKLVTFGIKPEYPETGYGYILRGDEVAEVKGAYELSSFIEKPNEETAEQYIKDEKYLWNSGMFMFSTKGFLGEIAEHHADMLAKCTMSLNEATKSIDFIHLEEDSFRAIEDISVDYAVMEKTSNAAVVPVSCGWSDAGAWDSLWRIGDKDENDNVAIGKSHLKDSTNCYLHNYGGSTIATLGVDNLTIISTKDVVMVADKSRSQDVKQLMSQVKEEEAELVDHHTKVFRPWGFYETIMLGNVHQVKHIQVKPKAKLSVQMHYKREEHWIIVSGTAKVLCGKTEHVLKKNDYIHIPLEAVHSVENIGDEPLSFIEVQQGNYLGEDDIVRFEDIYGREGTKG